MRFKLPPGMHVMVVGTAFGRGPKNTSHGFEFSPVGGCARVDTVSSLVGSHGCLEDRTMLSRTRIRLMLA